MRIKYVVLAEPLEECLATTVSALMEIILIFYFQESL